VDQPAGPLTVPEHAEGRDRLIRGRQLTATRTGGGPQRAYSRAGNS